MRPVEILLILLICRTAVCKALERLVNSGTIRRLARGLYDYPKNHPDFGNFPPNYERVAQALAGRDNLKIQPFGAYAANLLGLTEQVPAKIVLLTDGANRWQEEDCFKKNNA